MSNNFQRLRNFLIQAFQHFVENEDEQTCPQVEEQSDWREQIATWNKEKENTWRGQDTWDKQLDAWNELHQYREKQ